MRSPRPHTHTHTHTHTHSYPPASPSLTAQTTGRKNTVLMRETIITNMFVLRAKHCICHFIISMSVSPELPRWFSGKESTCQCERCGFHPWVRKIHPLEKEMATHSGILAWRIPWTEEPGGLQSTGSQRVGHDRATAHARPRKAACSLRAGAVSVLASKEA